MRSQGGVFGLSGRDEAGVSGSRQPPRRGRLLRAGVTATNLRGECRSLRAPVKGLKPLARCARALRVTPLLRYPCLPLTGWRQGSGLDAAPDKRTRPPPIRERLKLDARRSFRPSASLFSTRSAASSATLPKLAPSQNTTRLDNVTPIGAEGAASNDRPYSDPPPLGRLH